MVRRETGITRVITGDHKNIEMANKMMLFKRDPSIKNHTTTITATHATQTIEEIDQIVMEEIDRKVVADMKDRKVVVDMKDRKVVADMKEVKATKKIMRSDSKNIIVGVQIIRSERVEIIRNEREETIRGEREEIFRDAQKTTE
jgi:hypothetical protein